MTVLYVVTPTKERFRGLKQYGGSLKALDDADDLERWRWRIPRTQSLQLCANQSFAKTAADSESIINFCKAHKLPTFILLKLSKTHPVFVLCNLKQKQKGLPTCPKFSTQWRIAQKLHENFPSLTSTSHICRILSIKMAWHTRRFWRCPTISTLQALERFRILKTGWRIVQIKMEDRQKLSENAPGLSPVSHQISVIDDALRIFLTPCHDYDFSGTHR